MKNPFRGLSQHYTRRLAFASTLLTISSANYAFDNQAFAQTLALGPFQKQFGDYDAAKKKYEINSVWLSLFNSLLYITFSLGILIGTNLQARLGRRWTVRWMNVIPMISATIIVTSTNRWQLLAGRLIHYTYAGIELGCIPVYQAELVPAQVRGFAVGTYQMSYGIGNLLMNLIIKGTSQWKHSNASWRVPFGLLYVVPVVVFAGSWWLPESPRWLLSKGRYDEAREVLRSVRREEYADSDIEREMEQVLLILEGMKNQAGWSQMVKGNNKRRTFIICGTVIFNQITGNNFVIQYGALFVKSLGTVNPQTIGITNALGALSGTLLAMYATDKFGRRIIMMTGGTIQTAVLFVMGGLGSVKNKTHAIKAGISSLTPIQQLGYGFGSSSMNHVTSAEVPHQRLRDKSQLLVGVLNNLTAFAVAFSLPYLLNAPYANLGPKVGFIFAPFAFLSVLWAIFVLPECKGLSLEEINLLFYHKVSALKSASWKPPTNASDDLQDFAIHHGNPNAQVDRRLEEKLEGEIELVEGEKDKV